MTIKTFKRYENKYLLSEEQYRAVMAQLPRYMNADEHSTSGGYSIYNVYYDTEHDDIIRYSLSKPYYKEKLRLRSYQIPERPTDKVFVELKKKIGGVVSKRRATMTLEEAKALIENSEKPASKSYLNAQVVEEIMRFLESHEVTPKVFISYDRQAFFGKEDDEFRVTFDRNIQTRRSNVALEKGCFGKQLLEDGRVLMEVKISGAIPLWLAQVLADEKVYSTSFSKYGTEYKQYRRKAPYEVYVTQFLKDYLPASMIACVNQ